MCGADDFSKFRSRATGKTATSSTKSADESSPVESKQGSTSEAKRSSKNVALVTPPNEDIGLERDPVSVSIRKSSPGQPTHLELVSYYEKSGVYIKTIKPQSKFHGTKIQTGMKIIRVNGIKCPPSVKETFEHTATANDVLTLTAVVVESDYGEEDFMFKEIKLDDEEGKSLENEKEGEGVKGEKAPSPTRVSADWFGGYLGKKESEGEEPKKGDDIRQKRKERIKNTKKTAIATERDRIGLGFADRMLKNLGVIEPDANDDDSLHTYERDDNTFKSDPTLDDNTFTSAPTYDDGTYTGTYDDGTYTGAPIDDDDYTMSTTGGTTIVDSTPIIAKIFKKTKRDNLGLHFVSFKKKRGIYVYRIHEESRFLSTKLEPGMKLLAINDQPAPATVGETLALVQNIEGNLSIKAQYPTGEDVYYPEPPKNVTTEKKVDDLTGVQIPAPVVGAEKTQMEQEEKSETGDEDTNFIVGQLEDVQTSIADAVEDDEKEDDKKEGSEKEDDKQEEEAENADDNEDDNESSTYESLPPPRDEPQ